MRHDFPKIRLRPESPRLTVSAVARAAMGVVMPWPKLSRRRALWRTLGPSAVGSRRDFRSLLVKKLHCMGWFDVLCGSSLKRNLVNVFHENVVDDSPNAESDDVYEGRHPCLEVITY